MQLNRMIRTFALATIVVAGACGRDDKTTDAALQNDLSLAAQQQTTLDSVSALEAGTAATAAANNATLRAPAVEQRDHRPDLVGHGHHDLRRRSRHRDAEEHQA